MVVVVVVMMMMMMMAAISEDLVIESFCKIPCGHLERLMSTWAGQEMKVQDWRGFGAMEKWGPALRVHRVAGCRSRGGTEHSTDSPAAWSPVPTTSLSD